MRNESNDTSGAQFGDKDTSTGLCSKRAEQLKGGKCAVSSKRKQRVSQKCYFLNIQFSGFYSALHFAVKKKRGVEGGVPNRHSIPPPPPTKISLPVPKIPHHLSAGVRGWG